MRDSMNFEDRLTDAFAAYTNAAPQGVDPLELAAELARGGRNRRLALPTFNLTGFGGVRFAMVLGLLGLASVAGLLFAGGFLRSDPAPLGADGRILVWVQGSGTHLLRDGVEVPGSPRPSGHCPVLLATADAIAVYDRWKGYAFREFAGIAQSRWFNHNLYGGFERWSPDRSAFAMVDQEQVASVITFPDGDFVNPTVTRYPIVGPIDGFFSPDGSRLALPVAMGSDSLAIHVIEDGTDTIVATVPSTEGVAAGGSWSPDGERLVITTGTASGLRLTLVDLRDGSVRQRGRPGEMEAGASLVPLAWSGDGRYLVVESIPGAAWVLDVMRGQWQPLGTPIGAGGARPIRWSPDGRLGIIEGAWLTIHSFDGTSERKVKLPGSTPTWSPDGRSIATLAEGSDGEAVLLSTDAWETGESRQIAALRAADWSGSTPPGSRDPLCIQWQPDVQS